LLAGYLASLPNAVRTRLLGSLPRRTVYTLDHDWPLRGRDAQQPPEGDWRVWLLLAGRGFGKTRTGAEFVRSRISAHRAWHIALVAPTAADARDVMIEGESGLLAVSTRKQRPVYEPSKRRLTWPNGAIATTYPLDIVGRHNEVCDRCGGSGEVSADPPPTTMRQPGYVADLG
jgi:phage terminase large subunit-like protein